MPIQKHLIKIFFTVVLSLIAGCIVGFRIVDLKAGLYAGILCAGISFLSYLVLTKFKKEEYYFICLVTIFFITIITMSYTMLPAFHDSIYLNAKKKIPLGILINFERWEFQANISRLIYDILAFAAASASILVTLRMKDNDDKILKWAAYISALSLGIITAFNLGDKANNFRQAWRMMHSAIIKYEELDSYTIDKLIDSYEEAEKLIGSVKPDPR